MTSIPIPRIQAYIEYQQGNMAVLNIRKVKLPNTEYKKTVLASVYFLCTVFMSILGFYMATRNIILLLLINDGCMLLFINKEIIIT